jgi:hypothetical protein
MAEHEPSIGLSSNWFTPKLIFDAHSASCFS